MRIVPHVLLLLVLLRPAAGATASVAPSPAPQAFRQEIALHHEPAAGLPTGTVEKVAISGDGSAVAHLGGRWFGRRATSVRLTHRSTHRLQDLP